jgi:hypothetical protein
MNSEEQRTRTAIHEAIIERIEDLLRHHAHPIDELSDAEDPPDVDPTAYLYGELERSRDRVRQRMLGDGRALTDAVIADIVATGYLDALAAQNAELREHIAWTLDFIHSQDQDPTQ